MTFTLRMKAGPELWAVLAQLLVLVALGLGLQFVFWTTGGTLFLFSSAAPLLILVAVAIVGWLALAGFRRRHSVFQYQTFPAGELVYREGDPADSVYFIEDGAVEVSRDRYGEKQSIARLGAGEYFGEMSLLADQPNRSATVRALSATRVAVVGKENFLRMMFTVPSARDSILRTAHARFTGKAEDQTNAENPNDHGMVEHAGKPGTNN
jgi:cyclic nucleotide-binding protein